MPNLSNEDAREKFGLILDLCVDHTMDWLIQGAHELMVAVKY